MSTISPPARSRPQAIRRSAPGFGAAEPRRRRVLPLACLGLLTLALAAYVQRLGWSTGTFSNDEAWGVIGGRLLEADFWRYVTDTGHFNRGPERIVSLLQVPANALFESTPDQFRGMHVILAVAYFSTVFPAYALTRMLGLGRWPSVLVAALVVVNPWLLFGATLLTVTVGLPAMTLFAWATCRAALRPSLVNDALLLAAAAINTLARTGHAPLTAVALLVVAYAVHLRRPAGEAIGRSVLHLPVRVVRTHPLLVGAFALAGVAVALIGVTTVVGSGYASASAITLPWGSIWLHLRDWFAQLTMATGYLPLMIGAPWLLWQFVRPRTPETGVFAAMALGLFLAFVYLTSTHQSVSEERYVAVLAALPVVAFGAAVFRREAWPAGTLVVGLLAARAIATVVGAQPAPLEGFVGYQVGPARRFFQEVGLQRAEIFLPGSDSNLVLFTTLTLVAAAVVVAALCAPAVAWRLPRLAPRRTSIAACATAAVLVFGAAGGAWALEKYRAGAFPEKSLEELAWIERGSGGEPVFLWSHFSPETRDGRIYMGLTALHFNANTCCTLWLNDVQDLLGPNGRMPEPRRYMARFAGFSPLGFETTTVARSSIYGNEEMRLERFAGAPRAALRVFDAEPSGGLIAGRPATLRALPGAPRADRCVRIVLGSPVAAKRPLRYEVRSGRRTLRGSLRPTYGRTIEVPFARTITVMSPTGGADRLYLGDIAVVRCGR